ncbi:MAG: hypothetical protein R6W91_02270, partial [Thermoplasmata archaeon]
STMHLLVFSIWLFVEGIYRYNGRSLDPKTSIAAPAREKLLGIGLLALSGLAFGASVSTRYPTGLLVVIFPLYIFGFYLVKVWPHVREKNYLKAFKEGAPVHPLLGAFILGLLVALVPLMLYNSAYFGGPFNSGYDATSLMEFSRTGTLDMRNATAAWSGDIGSLAYTAYYNLFKLMPTFLSRMPVLLFLMPGIYCMRKRKLELAMLLAWASINAFTYLSLEWVTMYARPDLVAWEPRYWMPSLPAIAIIGGFGILGVSGWMARKATERFNHTGSGIKSLKVIMSVAIVGVLVLWSVIPAAGYLQDPSSTEGSHQPPQAMPVTTDQLLAFPDYYAGNAVNLNDAIIMGKSFQMFAVRSANATIQDTVSVLFVDWPVGTIPDYRIGQHVTIRGMFNQKPTPPGAPPIYNLVVKYGTQDFVRSLG